MSADTLPITSARFAEALKDLSLSSLHLKVLEIRNNVAHLDYSNEQLRPFAEGLAAPLGSPATTPQPDPDCVEAIRENEAVIARMQERILLVRTEVENRGVSWTEFQSKDEADAAAEAAAAAATTNGVALANGVNGHDSDAAVSEGHGQDHQQQAPRPTQPHSSWMDGTFQTGVISDGQLQMDPSPGPWPAAGGSLSDEELRRRMEEQLRGLGGDNEDEEEGGLHL